MRASGAFLFAAVAGLMLGGCASPPAAAAREARSASLVLPGEMLIRSDQAVRADAPSPEAWELSRNDARMGWRTPPAYRGLEYVEIVTRDRMRTINGRPSESSYTTNYSVRQRATY